MDIATDDTIGADGHAQQLSLDFTAADLAELQSALAADSPPPDAAPESPATTAAETPDTAAAETPDTSPPATDPDTQFRSRMAEWQAEQNELRVERERAATAARQVEQLQAKLAELEALGADPEKFLESRGYTVEDLARQKLSGETPETVLLRKLEHRLNSEAAERAKLEAKLIAQENERHVANFRSDIRGAVVGNEQFELLNLIHEPEAAVEAVYGLIEAHYQRTQRAGRPEILDTAKAAEQVEANLVAVAQKMLRAKKLSATGNETPAAPVTPAASTAPATPVTNRAVSAPNVEPEFQNELEMLEALAKQMQFDPPATE